ncbi:MAG: discoidin domain-containing protein [Eubacteriales bacterium]|nr:discoidin domain-containing protein [Eubacteriales bacterium]
MRTICPDFCHSANPETVYVLDLYRADTPISDSELKFLSVLPPFNVLAIKTGASRTTELCPNRELPVFSLSEAAVSLLLSIGVDTVLVDCACPSVSRLSLVEHCPLCELMQGLYRCTVLDRRLILEDVPRLPLGVRRDGSLYTRIQWANGTVKNPYYWVCNLIDDDLERFGGTWGANTMGPAHAIIDFFGESQTISAIRLFNNCGAPHSIDQEMSSLVEIYTSNDPICSRFGNFEQDIDCIEWNLLASVELPMHEQWTNVVLEAPVKAKFVRLTLVKNHGTPLDVPWVELSELKIYP